MTDETVGVNVGTCGFTSQEESLKQRVAVAQAAVETAAKELADAERALAEATAVAWVAYYSDDHNGWLDEEYVGFKVFPVSCEAELPWYINEWLAENFAVLAQYPVLVDKDRFGKVFPMSHEFQCKNDQKPTYKLFMYALFRTKAEAEGAEQLLREKYE